MRQKNIHVVMLQVRSMLLHYYDQIFTTFAIKYRTTTNEKATNNPDNNYVIQRSSRSEKSDSCTGSRFAGVQRYLV
jgi:hypothetical protein